LALLPDWRPTHMRLRRAIFAVLGAILLAPGIHPQDSVTTPGEEIPGTRSFYFGQLVDRPEALSGVWEAPDGQGGAVGIHLNLMTIVSDDVDPPAWTPQSWQNLNFGVFQRRGSEIAFGEEGYFADDPRGGPVALENGHLQLHFISAMGDISSVDLDLVHQAGDCWHGRFHRGSFDAVVTLCRPTPGPEVKQSPFVGTWSLGPVPRSDCVHIAQTGATTFTGWSDALEIPGHTIYGPNFPGPHSLLQSYGDLAKVDVSGDEQVSLELGAYSAVCCSQRFTGHLAVDGTTISGAFLPGPNQSPSAGVWTKRPGNTCVDSADLPKTHPGCEPSR
jgi:hypothetical protein